MAFVVRLSELEFLDATQVAVERMRSSAKRDLCHATVRRQRSLTTRLNDDVLGACAELAVAKWLGVQWSRSVDTFHSGADVGEDVDVRCTTNDNGSLIILRRMARGSAAPQPIWALAYSSVRGCVACSADPRRDV